MDTMGLGNDLIDVYAGGHLDTNTQNWLGQRFDTMRATLSTTAQNFFDTAQRTFTLMGSSEAIQALRNLTVKSEKMWQSNNIQRHDTLVELQTAGVINQRWLMACPEARSLYLSGELSGYAGSYENFGGQAIGETHFDYRLVMDGVITSDETSFQYTAYYQAMPEGERELELYEKADIINSWNRMRYYLDLHDEDPTCPYGNKMG